MRLQDHIELLKKIRFPNKKAYTTLILQIAKEHLTESGYLINPNSNDPLKLTIEAFVNIICPTKENNTHGK